MDFGISFGIPRKFALNSIGILGIIVELLHDEKFQLFPPRNNICKYYAKINYEKFFVKNCGIIDSCVTKKNYYNTGGNS